MNGPGGAPDTPERYLPQEPEGLPTVASLVIEAADNEEAREKQILWHLVQQRIQALRAEQRPVLQYDEAKAEAIALLRNLGQKLIYGL